MKYILLITSLVVFLYSTGCKSKATETDAADTTVRKGDGSDTTELFYPISQYIESQIAYVDSMPLAIEKHTFLNNRRTDSVIIDRKAFRQLAAPFLTPDINTDAIRSMYKESKFHDLTINTLTFSYNAKDPNAELQQKDILLNDDGTQRVKTVLFRQVQHHGDTTITLNGLWKHNMNFQISYLIEPKDGPMETRQVKIIWDRPLE